MSCEHSDVKEDISAHSINKKQGFLIYEDFKEKCTESNVAAIVLRAINGWNNFDLLEY